MKQGRFVFVSLALLSLFCLPVIGQPSSKSVETIKLDTFDGSDDVTWTWNVQASRFITEGYPKMGYFAGMPNSLRPLVAEDDPEPMVLGAQASFARKGDNWIEIYPVMEGEDGSSGNYEIPFIGTVSQIDFWVWGAGYKYFLEVMVRDAAGSVHVLPVTFLNFDGWRNVVVNIPSSMVQHSRLRSGPETLAFVGFRISSDPNEFVDDFVVYFDELKYTTNILANIYDGYDLRNVDFDAAQGEGESEDGTEAAADTDASTAADQDVVADEGVAE
ncbi:MAG TPA: flagellar filament outer layer protein FlaA [Candidatus Treponema faecavium]|nr:flagellar filament outer layer protein FlaA [Candidatus Treponema faecavium]